MKKLIFAVLAAVTLVFTACDEMKPNMILNKSTGTSGEMTIAISNELWKTETGKQIRKKFGDWEPGLGRLMAEKKFNIQKVLPKDLSTVYKHHRNVLLVKVTNSITVDTAVIEMSENLYANQQFYVTVRAKNQTIIENYFRKNGRKLVRKFEEAELKRIVELYKTHPSVTTQNKIKKEFKIDMTIDKGYAVVSNKEGFMMIERSNRYKRMEFDIGGDQKLNILEGIMIWQSDYRDKIQFDKAFIHHQRDTILKYNVQFPTKENAYMTTEYDSISYPVQHAMLLNDKDYAVESKGHYRGVNFVMGGPFVQLTVLHPKTNKIINIMGWVHAPSVDKIELVRHLEAMIKDVKFLDPKKETEKEAA